MMTMRVGTSDMSRRQKFNQILQTVGVIGTKEAVQETLLSSETSTLISKMNWKVQKKVLRKVKNMAESQVLVVDSDFGRMYVVKVVIVVCCLLLFSSRLGKITKPNKQANKPTSGEHSIYLKRRWIDK
jgi:hypothetical protein